MTTSTHWGTTNQYIEYWIEVVQNFRDFDANKSNVTVKVWVQRTNSGYTTYGTGTVYCTINGGAYSAGITTSDKITSTAITLFTKTLDIPHDSDGDKNLKVSASISHSVFDASSHTYSVDLVAIPRATQPTLSAYTVNYGATVTINTPRADPSFTHTLRYSWNTSSGQITTGVGTSYNWIVPLSFMNNIPNSTASWGTIYCDTYNGGTLIGTKTVRLDTLVPSTIVPSFTSITAVDTNTAVTTLAIGSYVQSVSKPKFTINGAAGTYSSTITKYEFTVEGNTYAGNNYTLSGIKGNGTVVVTAKVTDSRGRTKSGTLNLTVLAYSPPVITAATVQRANSDGTLNDVGTYAKVTHNGTWNSLNAKNTVTINTYAKARGASSWGTAIKTISAGSSGTYSGSFTSTQTYTATGSFDFRIDFVDKFNTTMSLFVMSTGLVTMSWAPGGIGVGKMWQQGALDVNGDMYISGKVYGNLGSTRIPASSNLDDYVNEGLYYCSMSADAATITNVPEGIAFSLFVEKHAGVKQTFTTYPTSGWTMYVRNKYQTTWGPWTVVGSDIVFTNLTLQNGAAVGTGRTPRYCKNGELVTVEGEITSVAGGTVIATLPAGYRPPVVRIFKNALNSSTTNDGATVYVNTDGTIVVLVSANSTNNISLNGISFYIS